MRLAVPEARELSVRAVRATGYDEDDARVIAEHVLDAALCGYEYSGLAKILNILDNPRFKNPREPMSILRESSVSVLFDGGNNNGMLAVYRAAQAAMDKAVTKALAGIRESLKSGKPLSDAATAAGVKTTPFTAVSLTDEKAPMEQRKYAAAARLVGENEVSGFQPDYGGGFAVWVEKRLPVDQKKFDENRSQIVSEILSQRQLVLFRDWLSTAQKESGLSFYGNHRG